jgi:hypothetical protein
MARCCRSKLALEGAAAVLPHRTLSRWALRHDRCTHHLSGLWPAPSADGRATLGRRHALSARFVKLLASRTLVARPAHRVTHLWRGLGAVRLTRRAAADLDLSTAQLAHLADDDARGQAGGLRSHNRGVRRPPHQH